jgi:hypothetical protein
LGAQAGGPQLVERYAGNVEVDRLAEHVLAVLGDAAGAPAQHGIGVGRAIAADHPDRLLGADLAMNLPQKIDQMGIHRDVFGFAPVAQNVVDLPERVVVVPAVHLVGDRQILAGVDMMEGDCPRFAVGADALQALAAEKNQKSGDAAAVARPT